MQESATAEQVKRAVASDWRNRSVTYHDVARLTGYKYPTIANIMSNKKSYFTLEQVSKISSAFGYNRDYLIWGTGELKPKDEVESAMKNRNDFMTDSFRLSFLLNCVKEIGEAFDNTLLKRLYADFKKIMTTTDPLECAEMMQELQESLMMTMLSHGKNITSFSLSAPDYDEIYGMVSSMIHKNNDGEDEGVESDDDDDDGSEVTLSRNNEDDDEDEGN